MEALAPIGLASVTAALLALPVLPAVYELHKRGDVAPLPTSRHDGNIENFADAFRSRVAPVLTDLQDFLARGEVRRIKIGEMEALLVGREDFSFDLESLRGVDSVICTRGAVPPGRLVQADLYASQGLHVGERAALRAAFVDGEVTIASGATVLRWIHASRSAMLQKGARSYGRLSSLESVYLAAGSRFQRVHAPCIFTVSSSTEVSPEPNSQTSTSETLSSAYSEASQRTSTGSDALLRQTRVRIHGDFVLPPGETADANLIVSGSVRLSAGAQLYGSIKGYKDMVVDKAATVHGSIVCGGTLQVGPNCIVAGPVMAEREVRISRGARIGTADSPTTISSPAVRIATGCQIHGTIWARVSGTIED